MVKEKEHQSLRQRLFPTMNEAEEIAEEKYNDDSATGLGILVYRWARSFFLVGAISYGSCQGIGNNIKYSQGTRAGMVNKISEKGLVWKTYEGQMALEGIVSGNNSVGANVWDFSIDRQARRGENPKELAEKIGQYLGAGTKVKVTYVEPLTIWPWRAGTHYLIQSVEPVEKAE